MMNKSLDVPMLEKFMKLVCALSPENLHCDGEISRAAAARKYRALKAEWRKLEKSFGRTVSEDEVWRMFVQTPRHQGAR